MGELKRLEQQIVDAGLMPDDWVILQKAQLPSYVENQIRLQNAKFSDSINQWKIC